MPHERIRAAARVLFSVKLKFVVTSIDGVTELRVNGLDPDILAVQEVVVLPSAFVVYTALLIFPTSFVAVAGEQSKRLDYH